MMEGCSQISGTNRILTRIQKHLEIIRKLGAFRLTKYGATQVNTLEFLT